MECTRFFSFTKGSLLGFADIYIPKWDAEICGVRLYQKDGKRWVSVPGSDYDKGDGEKFSPFLKFRDKGNWEAFVKKAKDAIEEFCAKQAPSALNKQPSYTDSEMPF